MNIQQIIQNFEHTDFDHASLEFFKHLNVPLNRLTEESIDVNELLGEHKEFSIVDTTYMVGGIDDNIFNGQQTNTDLKIKRYDGLLIFAINLNITNPTRTQLSNISRIFNRKFQYTPVVILFKYDKKLSLSNTQRQEYKQQWRDGEKVGKVSILRDIDIANPHRGHLDILEKMRITSKVSTYEELYQYWQEVFDVSLLNKKFYQELSNWYSYAVKEVVFPNQPKDTDSNAIEEHKSQNVIRLLTRFLFVWFIKEKGLIPNELFEEEYIKSILKDFNPKNMDGTLFSGQDKSSIYYKAILQNLFFASLNCPIEPLDKHDTRARGFRKKEHYGQNRDANFLMRYEDSFNKPQEFLKLINEYVPFLNGGLFECLDDKTNGVYIDGFSDNLVKAHKLIVPDYLFFGVEEHVDLSAWYGSKNKAFKDATVKGLIKILDSYKFTVAENTPIEEDVALDPELLGRVFENLLASYNPETKTTARKQTGSFYTPREIVSYMVDESLIAYLKTKLEEEQQTETLEENLRELCSYSDKQPFTDEKIIIKLINALDKLKALDPAVGSGAFPMGMLQKMVHILSKLDPENTYWQELQLEKAKQESDDVFETKDKEEREKLLIEINNAFDETINNPDYARKLYIIENSIYGVDIQSIAIQISKLRFFISLVIEQKIDKTKPNFGVRPLPNLETKFIAANTLIGIDKDNSNLFNDEEIKTLEKELKNIRHRLFNAKTPQTKRKLRRKDKELREKIAQKLEENGLGNESAKLLAHWDPYEQNVSSPFFDMEWMFGIRDGFDVVIGNPPYMRLDKQEKNFNYFKKNYLTAQKGKLNTFKLFYEKSIKLNKLKGILSFITPNTYLTNSDSSPLRKYFLENVTMLEIIEYTEKDKVFENVTQAVTTFLSIKKHINICTKIKTFKHGMIKCYQKDFYNNKDYIFIAENNVINCIKLSTDNLTKYFDIYQGEINLTNKKEYLSTHKINNNYLPMWRGIQVGKYKPIKTEEIDFCNIVADDRNHKATKRIVMQQVSNQSLRFRTKAFISDENILCGNSTNYLKYKHNAEDLYIYQCIINSLTFNYYFNYYSFTNHITVGELENIPIPEINNKVKRLFMIFSKLINIKLSIFEQIIDGVVFELYFRDHMKEKQINIIEFVEQDIKEVIGDKDLDTLDDDSKEEVIQKLYDKWTHPDNEVRNRMKLFAVRSPDILKPILES